MLRMRIAEDFPSLGNPDDLELFERCQEGLAIAEVEWVDMSKGLGHETEEVSADGVVRAPVTYEGPMRGLPAGLAGADVVGCEADDGRGG